MSIFENKELQMDMSTINKRTTPLYELFINYINTNKNLNFPDKHYKVDIIFKDFLNIFNNNQLRGLSNAYKGDKCVYILPLFLDMKKIGYIKFNYTHANGDLWRILTFYDLKGKSFKLMQKQGDNGTIKLISESYQRILGLSVVEKNWETYLENNKSLITV